MGFVLVQMKNTFWYELVKYLEEVIVPYFKKQRSIEGLYESQEALVIMDVSTGKMTPEIIDS